LDEADTDLVIKLEAQEARLVFDSFDHAAAWRLGTLMVERALLQEAPVIIDIRRPGLILFRSALTGATAENEAWLERKAHTVFRFETSTELLRARFATQGIDLWTAPWFDTQQYTAAGGSFPVRVHGVGVVAAVTVSGIDNDHDFLVAALEAYIDRPPPPHGC